MPVTTNEAKYWCWVLNACGSSQRCWIGLWWGFLHTKLLKAFPYGPVSVSSCWNRRKGINSLEEEWFLKVYCAVRYTAGHFLIRRSDFDSMVWVTSFWAREKQKTSWRQFFVCFFSQQQLWNLGLNHVVFITDFCWTSLALKSLLLCPPFTCHPHLFTLLAFLKSHPLHQDGLSLNVSWTFSWLLSPAYFFLSLFYVFNLPENTSHLASFGTRAFSKENFGRPLES